MLTDTAPAPLLFAPVLVCVCAHRKTRVETAGGFHFDPETGPCDDVREVRVCLECGAELPVLEPPAAPAAEPDTEPLF